MAKATERELSICFSVYGQPKMLAHWFARFLEQPQEWRDRVEVIVVDDAGTPKAAVPDAAGIVLLRVLENIKWNQGGARNLAAKVATTSRLMLIDPDMTLGEGMLERLVVESRHLRPGLVFRPALKHVATGKLDHTSPNVHLILREDFERAGGYDEDYAGNKGWSDVQLLRVMQRAFTLRDRDDLWFWFHHGDKDVPDAQVKSLDRSVQKNKALHIRKLTLLKKLGWKAFVQKTQGRKIRFLWQRIQ